MRYAAAILCLLASFASSASAASVSGTVKDPAGAGISGRIELKLSHTSTTGSELLLIQPTVTCQISSGAIAGGCTVRGNDTVSSPAGTFYCVRILSASGRELMPARPYTITGASFDVGTATQATGKECK